MNHFTIHSKDITSEITQCNASNKKQKITFSHLLLICYRLSNKSVIVPSALEISKKINGSLVYIEGTKYDEHILPAMKYFAAPLSIATRTLFLFKHINIYLISYVSRFFVCVVIYGIYFFVALCGIPQQLLLPFLVINGNGSELFVTNES